jgi:hypothetical protein
MKLIVQFALLFLFVTPSNTFAQNAGSLSGYIIDANTKKPIEGATINIKEINVKVISDSLGKYRFNNIKTGNYTLSVNYLSYQNQSKYNIPITSGNENEISFELVPNFSSINEVTVQSNRRTARVANLSTPLSVQLLTTEEIKANPGGNFDISRVINSLPGVTGATGSVGGFRNDIIVRGGGPSENIFYLDGIEIPIINHFATQGSGGGPTGILNVSLIEDVKLSTSAFDAKFDNALSSVFEFKQKQGNTTKTQGNVRLSATEFAATLDGPLSKKNNLTYLASVRRSYLQLLFSAIDLPIRPNFWDFQHKITYKPNTKSTLTFLGVGAIDAFSFGKIKKPTQDKIYIVNQGPSVQQKSYTVGFSYRRTLNNGFYNVALSRNALENNIEKYDNNDPSSLNNLRYVINSTEIENKLRFDVNKTINTFKFSYGGVVQLIEYDAASNVRVRANVGSQPEQRFLFTSRINYLKYGAFVQLGKRFFYNKLGVSVGLRTDANSFTTKGHEVFQNLSPRISLNYNLNENFNINASVGRYSKMASNTILGYRDNNNSLVNQYTPYIKNTHYVVGFEYLPKSTTRFTLEGFYKKYDNVPITLRDGINLNNLGADFGVVGNEAITGKGIGESYGIELFAQQKLTKRFFGIFSYTFFYSRFSNLDGNLKASAWDNRHLVNFTFGYKFKRNWELGVKYRYQGGVPYTPFDMAASQQNFLTQGQGLLDYSQFNNLRLGALSSSDLRIDKKWNYKKTTLDLFLDITNWWAAKQVAYPRYSFERDLTTQEFKTTDGQPIKADGSNGIPIILFNYDGNIIPTIGFIVEF